MTGLRQRYGVSGGPTSEPKIMDVRHGPEVIFNVSSLKAFNEDLNTLEQGFLTFFSLITHFHYLINICSPPPHILFRTGGKIKMSSDDLL